MAFFFANLAVCRAGSRAFWTSGCGDWTHLSLERDGSESAGHPVWCRPGPSMESCGEQLWLQAPPEVTLSEPVKPEINHSTYQRLPCPAIVNQPSGPLHTVCVSFSGVCVCVCVMCVSACVTKWIEGVYDSYHHHTQVFHVRQTFVSSFYSRHF